MPLATAIAFISFRKQMLSFLWAALLICCLSAVLTVVLGFVFKRSAFWWVCAVSAISAVLLSIIIAILDKLGFG